MQLSVRYDPYSDTALDDYRRLKSEVVKIDVASIFARELGKTRIDPAITKQAINALRVLEPDVQKRILESLLQDENLQRLAPVFPRLMTVLRAIYSDLDEDIRKQVDDQILGLIKLENHVTALSLNMAYAIRVLRNGHTPAKESVFSELYEKNAHVLVKREIILAMTEWENHPWLSDLKTKFNTLSRWEKDSFIVSSYYLTDEGSHWRNSNKGKFSPLELAVRDWFSDRFSKNRSVPS